MKKIIKIFLLFVLMIPGIVLAENITKADLEASAAYINDICNTEEKTYFTDEGKCSIPINMVVQDDKIVLTITPDAEEGQVPTPEVIDVAYTINENGKVDFAISIPINKGMTKDAYTETRNKTLYVLYPSLLVAHAKGAKIADYMAYFTMSVLQIALSMDTTQSPKYIIVGEGVTVENQDQYALVIPENEFGDYVIRLAELEFANPNDVKDDKEGMINSFVMTMPFTKTDDEHGTLQYKMTVDSNADYSKVAGAYEKLDTMGQLDSVDPSTQPTQPAEKNPKTGVKLEIFFVVGMMALGIALSFIYKRRLIQRI